MTQTVSPSSRAHQAVREALRETKASQATVDAAEAVIARREAAAKISAPVAPPSV